MAGFVLVAAQERDRAPEVDHGLPPDVPRRAAVDERLVVAVTAVVVVAAVAWGTLVVDGVRVGLRAAPFAGRWGWHGGLLLVPALVVAAVTVAWGPQAAARLRWPWVPLATGAAAAAWTVALAAGDGWARLSAPLTSRHEYEPLAGRVGDLDGFVGGYVDRLGGYPIHVQGHPPGPVVVAWALDRVGLGGAGWLAAVAITGWGAAAAAALVTARVVAGEGVARRAAPLLVLLPASVWAGTSLDGLFAGIVAAGIALAATGAGRGSRRLVLVAGMALGSALLLTYGTIPLLLVPVVLMLALAGHPARMLGVLGAGVVVPLALAALAGFGWFDGLAATRAAYWSGIAAHRPAGYLTLLGNPAVLAVAVGPAVVVGLADVVARTVRRGRSVTRGHDIASGRQGRVPDGLRTGILPLAMLAVVVVADLSQHARGEVERIWLPFVPWLALAAPRSGRRWLAAQAGVALVVQSVLVSPW